MEDMKICIGCQDFEENVGQEAKWCPNIVCQKCEQKGHTKITCMSGHEDLKTLPNEILLKIIGYVCDDENSKVLYPTLLDALDDFSKVSKRFQETCEAQKKILIKKTMTIQEVTLESLPLLLLSVSKYSFSEAEKLQEEHAKRVMFANPNLTSSLINQREENLKQKQHHRDVNTGATIMTEVASEFSDTLTLEGADSAYHCKGRTQNFPVDTSLYQQKLQQTRKKQLQLCTQQYQQGKFKYKLKVLQQRHLCQELTQYQTQHIPVSLDLYKLANENQEQLQHLQDQIFRHKKKLLHLRGHIQPITYKFLQ
jgi:hypothetical protein